MSFIVAAAATAATSLATAGAITGGVGAAITAGSIGGAAAGIGAGAATAGALGAGVGAISAAAQGQDVGKGALMGAASGVATAGVAGGLGAAVGPAASGVGQVVQGAVIGGTAGAAGGAAGAATGGEDVGTGALMGGATGAVAGGAMGAMPAPSEVPSIGVANPSAPAEGAFSSLGTGEVVGSNAGAAQFDSAIGSVPGTTGYTPPATLGGTPTTTTSSGLGLGDIGPKIGIQPATALGSAEPTGVVGGPLSQIKQGLTGAIAGGGVNYTGSQMIDSQAAASKAASEDAARAGVFANQNQAGMANLKGLGFGAPSGPLSSLSGIGKATGGLTALAHGGQIPLKDGAYIIPADVVSALGNGSSKAGAEFLRHLMMEVRKEAVNIQGLGAAKKHGA